MQLDILFVTPESFQLPSLLVMLDRLHESGNLSMFGVDEAHCISTWGHDFRCVSVVSSC